MILNLSASGGFAGLAGPQVTVDLAELPEAQREMVCEALGPERLAALGAWRPGDGADRETYWMEWVTDEGERQPFQVPEAALSPESLDLIDMLFERGAPGR